MDAIATHAKAVRVNPELYWNIINRFIYENI